MTTQPVSRDTLLNQLRWRYATKQFDPKRRISDVDWRALEEALLLTPSSFGLQPWKFVVVTDPATKEKLVPLSWGQRQLADASHVVVFAVRKDLSLADADRYLAHMAAVRGITVESLKSFRGVLAGFLSQPAGQFNVNEWATRQVYIALGNFLTSAAVLGIDACPMEGIEPAKYDELLGLPAQGYRTAVVATAGYRSPEDKYASLPKVRFSESDLITRIR